MKDARAARAAGCADAATVADAGGAGAAGGAVCAPAQPARTRTTDVRKARMREGSVGRRLAADAREATSERWPRATSASSGVLTIGQPSAERREVGQRVHTEQQPRRIAKCGELRRAEPTDG